MKKALINSLKLDNITRLTIEEKGEIILNLKSEYQLSYRELENLTGIPHSTLLDWATGRQKNVAGCLHISIRKLVEHFEIYEPKDIIEWGELVRLKKVIDKRLSDPEAPRNKLNKIIGWEYDE